MSENKNKVTKVKRYADIVAILRGEPVAANDDGTPRTTIEDAIAFLTHESELVTKKNAAGDKKQSENALKNEQYKALIMDYMLSREDRSGMTCTAIGNSIAELVAEGFGTSKFSSLCNGLVTDGKLSRKVGKGGKVLFSLPDNDEDA